MLHSIIEERISSLDCIRDGGTLNSYSSDILRPAHGLSLGSYVVCAALQRSHFIFWSVVKKTLFSHARKEFTYMEGP